MPRIESRPTRATRAKPGHQPRESIEDRLLAAMERLLEKGQRFAALSVEQLTQEAGISRATFYLHFRDKGELVARLMGQVTEELIASTGAWLGNADDAQRKDLQQALVGVVQTFRKHQAILAAVSDTAPHDPSVASLYQAMIDRTGVQTRRSLATVKRKGLSRPAADNDVADALSEMIVTYCIRNVGKRDGAELNRLAKALGYIAASAVFSDTS
ncbi:MAG: TetR/AcrR family transcriptional regulator [Panacagrimonas sp.]